MKLFTLRKISLLATLMFLLGSTSLMAQISVTATAGTAGPTAYTTLKGAFDAINAGTHQGAITVNVTGNTNEGTATAILNASASGAASYTSILVQPSGGAFTISGATTAGSALINLNGADNVTFDGLNSGGNALTIENTTVSANSGTSTVLFIGGATNNTITRCSVKGACTSSVATNGATIFFSTDANTSNGNDNNTISLCDIGPSGTNLPTKAILGNGSTTTTAIGNSGNIINNNNIFDFFGAAVTSSGVATNGGCNTWSITNNRFYQTGTRTWTTGATHRAIDINNTSATSGAQGFTITGNIVGYASNTQTGTYTLTGSTGKFQGIVFNGITLGTVSNINTNTIASVSLSGVTSNGSTSTATPFAAILVLNGLANTNNNTIGSQTSTGSLVFSTTTTTASDIYGIYNFSGDLWTATENSIGGISVTNAGASGTFILYGIRANTGTSVAFTATSNLIGGTVSNSIQLNATGVSSQVIGIHTSNAPAVFTSNTIRNLTSNIGTGTGSSASIVGVSIAASSSNHTVAQNTIHTLKNTSTSAATFVHGMNFNSSTGTNVISRNNIHSLSVASATGGLAGINIIGGTATYSNNMIRLGLDETGASITVGCAISGIAEITAGIDNILFNSVYIGGTGVQSGTVNTFAFQSSITTNTRQYRNNIFQNSRSNAAGTGKHYGIRVGGSGVNPGGLTSSHNVIFTDGTGGVFGLFNSIDRTSLSDWQSATGQEANSWSANPQYLLPNGTATTGDLHINSALASPVEGLGLDIVTITTDFDGQTRSGLTPVDIGADALTGTPLPFCSGAPTAGTITSASSNLCTGNTGITLTLSGATAAPGISYQWASSTTNGGPYTNLGTAQTQATGAISATTYFVVSVTCSVSSQTATTTQFTLNFTPSPTVTASSNTPVCVGTALNLTSTPSAGTVFAWAGPNSFTNATQNPSIASTVTASAGTYTVSVTNNGCTGTATTAVVINPQLAITATATPPSVCSGANSQLLVTAPLSYTFSASSSTYTALTGATPVTLVATGIDPASDEGLSAAIPLGFSLNYQGAPQSEFRISSNGFISFNSSITASALTNNLSTGASTIRPLIAPLWDDLDVASVSYLLTGSAPNRVMTVEWKNAKWNWQASAAGISFQARMYEVDGKIEFLYNQEAGALNSASASIGLSGTSTYLSLSGAGTSPTASSSTETTSISTRPATGQMYTFSPPVVPTFAWSPATFLSATNIANPVATAVTTTTLYTVTVTSGNGCTSTATANVSVTPLTGAAITATPTNATVCRGQSVSLVAAPTGGAAPYTYAWSAGAASPAAATTSVTPTALTTTYTVTITDFCSATTTASITVTSNPIPVVTASASTPACLGGSVTFSSTSDLSGSAFSWAGPSTFTSALQNPVRSALTTAMSGTYTVTVTNTGCSATRTVAVVVNNLPTGVSASPSVSPICLGSAIDLTSTGAAPASASAYNFAASTGSFTPITGGTVLHSTGVDDAMSSTTNIGFTFNYNGSTFTQFKASSNGFITFNTASTANEAANSLSGSTSNKPVLAPFWDDLSTTTANSNVSFVVTGVSPNRVLTVEWLNMEWSYSASEAVISFQAKLYELDGKIEYVYRPEAGAFVTHASGIAGASIGLGGTSTGTGTFLSLSDASAAPTASSTTETSLILTKPANGQVYTFTAPLPAFAWSGPGSYTSAVQNPTGVIPPAAGVNTYTVVASSSAGCTVSATTSVTVQPALGVTATATIPSCVGSSNASATAVGTGGDGTTYAYTWNAGGATTSATNTGLAAGTYTVSVTSGACTVSAVTSVTVSNPVPVTAASSSSVMPSCNGGSNGSITVVGQGGAGSYTYSSSAAGGLLTGLSAGTYTVTITDANLCTGTTAVTVNQPTALTVSASQTSAVSCFGGSNGTVSAIASGGTPAYTYAWSGGGASALAAGNYTVTATDNNGCNAITSVAVSQPDLLVASLVTQTSPSCFGGNNATATLTAIGGTLPYTGLNVTGLTAGAKALTVTDNNGCTSVVNVNISQPTLLTVSATMTAPVTCNGLANGTATAVANGGTAPYSYAWANPYYTGANGGGLSAGTQAVVVVDANQCTAFNMFTITQPAVLTVATMPNAPTCATGAYLGTDNGNVIVTPAGGNAPYTVAQPVSGLVAGNYNFTVTDNKGCTATATAVVPQGAANTTYYKDADADSYGNAAVTILSCTGVPSTYVANSTDCNDNSNVVFPGALEVCGSAVDNNCDGIVGFVAVAPSLVSQVVTGGSVNLIWSGSCAFRYRIQVQRVGTSNWLYYYANGAASSITIPTLAPGTYRWTVRAQSGSNSGPYTNPMATPNTFVIPSLP